MIKIKIHFTNDEFKILEVERFEDVIGCLKNNEARIVVFPIDNVIINMDNVLYIERIEK